MHQVMLGPVAGHGHPRQADHCSCPQGHGLHRGSGALGRVLVAFGNCLHAYHFVRGLCPCLYCVLLLDSDLKHTVDTGAAVQSAEYWLGCAFGDSYRCVVLEATAGAPRGATGVVTALAEAMAAAAGA